MSIRKKYRLLCLILAGVVLLSMIGLLWYRADWRFRLWNAIRIYPKPDLKEVAVEAEPITLEDAQASGALNSLLLLVNSDHPLPQGYVPELAEYNGAQMHPQMVDAYVALRDVLLENNWERIHVSSDYRAPEEQAELLESKGDAVAAKVGCSEHEAGLALDVYVKGYGSMSFIKTRAGRETTKLCGKYGFIIRYPEGKEEITGISYEPWHLRYVGQPHARIIMESGLTLEEYLELFEVGVWYESGEYLVGRFDSESLELPAGGYSAWSVSPDNTGYYIITVTRD